MSLFHRLLYLSSENQVITYMYTTLRIYRKIQRQAQLAVRCILRLKRVYYQMRGNPRMLNLV